MITTKTILNKLLDEKYVSSKKTSTGYIEIFENPTNEEILDIAKSTKPGELPGVRFVANAESEKLYIANAWASIHSDILKLLHLPEDYTTPDVICGVADINSSGNLIVISLYDKTNRARSDYNWNWMKKYLDFSKIKLPNWLK